MKNSYKLSEIPKHLRKYFTPINNPVLHSPQKYRPTCECDASPPIPGTCLDPFAGSGTTGLVGERLGLDTILIEISEEYAKMSRDRIVGNAPMFNKVKIVEA